MKQITGADLFVKALKKEAVDILFAYPGGQAIDLFDALYGEKEIDVILPRHEQGLIHAADGYARSTGKVGVCLVTSGPGAANLVTGIATANYDSDFYPEKIAVSGYEPDTSIHMGQLNKALDILNHAVKPVFLIGGGVLIARAKKEMTRLAELTGVPVITTIMGKGAVPTANSLYVGNIGIHGSYAENAKIIHIDVDAASISRKIDVDVSITADAKKAVCALLEKAGPLCISEWTDEINRWKKEYPIELREAGMTPQRIIQSINELFKDAVITTDVGQNQLWTTQFLDIDEKKQMLTSGGLGTMGYGLPAGIGAKLGNPHKDVIVISGDGGMQMNIQEMATAVVYELPIIICILNNGYLGNVRQWQEMFYERRYSSTCMRYRRSCETGCNRPDHGCPEYTPDFIALAESYGAKGIRVIKAEDIKAALLNAKQNKKTPTIIEFIIDREANVMPIVPPGNPLHEMIPSVNDGIHALVR